MYENFFFWTLYSIYIRGDLNEYLATRIRSVALKRTPVAATV